MGRGGMQGLESKHKQMYNCSKSESRTKSHDHATKNANQKLDNKNCEVISKLLFLKQKSDNKEYEVVSNLLLFPEDLIIGILRLVPLNCLLNSASYVCRFWATTIDSYTRSKPGLYVENRILESSSYFLDIKEDANGQFERIDLGTPPRMGHLISSCDGILLLCDSLRRTFVANPILKCWLQTPPLPSDCRQFTIARVPRSSKFKLFLVDVLKVLGSDWYVFHVLRIGIDNSWKEIHRKEALLKWCFFWQPVYSGGNNLYWITRDGVIVMDIDREVIVGEYPLPPSPVNHGPIGIFLWMKNCLSCILHKDPYTTYQIYILDIESAKWTLYHEMGPFDYVSACGHEVNILCVVFRLWINEQIIFKAILRHRGKIFTGLKKIHFGYNVKTRQVTKIDAIAVGDFEVWLHTNSLVSLPSTPT